MIGTGLLGPGQRVVFLGLGELRFSGHLARHDARLAQQQLRLIAGELFSFGSKQTDIEQADLFVFKLDDALQPEDLSL